MPKGKPWSANEEKELRELVGAKKDADAIAEIMGKSSEAVTKKCKRLGLEVVGTKAYKTTTSLKLPDELPSVEEALKILAGALKAAKESGLDKVEVQRLQVVATLTRTYKDLLAEYINYREIEARLVDLEKKYEELLREKTKGDASKPDTPNLVQPAAQ